MMIVDAPPDGTGYRDAKTAPHPRSTASGGFSCHATSHNWLSLLMKCYNTLMKSFWHDLPQPFFVLAPMEAVTDVVFRHVVRRAGGPDVFFTEFANATGWVHAGDKAIAGRLLRTDDEQPLVAQIWGGEPGDMERFAAHCASLGYDGIDINMGCPAKSAIKSGGAALIRRPEVAVAAIAAAKTAGLPVSVKTRLGYTSVDEWREWLATLLRQDIVNLTVHLRTKKEMSKVPAHFELIDDIVRLRDAVAPQTLLTINGDIRDRAHGLALATAHPGINGLMIGRGVFHDPFCFRVAEAGSTNTPLTHHYSEQSGAQPGGTVLDDVVSEEGWRQGTVGSSAAEPDADNFAESPAVKQGQSAATPPPPEAVKRSQIAGALAERSREISSGDLSEECTVEEDSGAAAPLANKFPEQSGALASADARSEAVREISVGEKAPVDITRKAELIALLRYHLDLFDHWQPRTCRPYETLKRFFKIYIRDFDGAKELRDQLMHTKTTDEVRRLLSKI